MRLHPFTAWRPAPEAVASVASPPYDVVSRAEAAALAKDNPLSFLHVVRSEIDLPEDVDPYDARVYATARENLERLIRQGTLRREPHPALYLYRLAMGGRAQVGVAGCVHVDDYGRGVIKKHETTRRDKEDDRTRHMLALDAHPEAVLLAYRGSHEIERLAMEGMERPPHYDFTAAGGVRHTLWTLPDPVRCVEAFDRVTCAYVADGHHRSASAWRAARQQRAEHRGGGGEHEWFPAVLFPAEQLRILPYNRLIADLGGQTPGDVLAKLGKIGRVSVPADPMPPRPGSFCIYLDRHWYLLELTESSIDRADALASLDVALLQERVLAPVLGVGDPRTDKRIDFVGGLRGPHELEARVDSGEAALAVSLYPTTVEQLMAVSDLGQVMPPKSTWFEPKLASGLFVHSFDRAAS
jgi:uncharacterized protein (DUF1015 family)